MVSESSEPRAGCPDGSKSEEEEINGYKKTPFNAAHRAPQSHNRRRQSTAPPASSRRCPASSAQPGSSSPAQIGSASPTQSGSQRDGGKGLALAAGAALVQFTLGFVPPIGGVSPLADAARTAAVGWGWAR